MFKKLINSPINAAKDKIGEYVQLKLEEIKLNAIEKVSPIAGYMVLGALIAFSCMLLLTFLGLGLAFWFSALFGGNYIAGFFVASGIFLLLLIIVILLSKNIIKAVTNMITKFIL